MKDFTAELASRARHYNVAHRETIAWRYVVADGARIRIIYREKRERGIGKILTAEYAEYAEMEFEN